jgi:hypothetical protein
MKYPNYPTASTDHPCATSRAGGRAARSGCRFAGDFTRVLIAIIVGLAASLVATLAVALAPLAAMLGMAAPAHADGEVFLACPSGHSGIATTVTSCLFAENVRHGYLTQSGQMITAYSPVTGLDYDMQCASGFISNLDNGATVPSVRCVGGNNAVVIVY